MKFVFCGYDFTIDIPKRLIADGHDLIAIFTFECDNIFNFNTQLHELAAQRGIPVTQKPITATDIDPLIAQGAGVFLAAGYLHKIPAIDENQAYSINVHPSLLPKGRGIMPIPYILLDHREAAGISAHKITAKLDAGDILLQHAVTLSPCETVESYAAKLGLLGPEMVSQIFADLPQYWQKAVPQDEKQALYFPPPDDRMRLLDFTLSIETIDARARAFGRYGSLAIIDGALFVIYDHDAWKQPHNVTPGTIAARLQNMLVIAAADGFVCLKECHKIQQ